MTSNVHLRPLTLLCLMSAFLSCGLRGVESRAENELAGSKKKKASPQEMSEAIEKVLKLKTDSYHVFLREASLLAPPLLKGQDWSDIQKLMAKHGFTVVKAWENGDAIHSHHLAKRNAVVFPSGYSLDLQFQLSARNLDRGRFPAKPGKLYAADVVLVSKIAAPYAKVVQDRGYPKGSILDALLTSEKLKEEGGIWPILNSISVHYGYIFDRWAEHSPSGFHIAIEFVASTKEEIGGNQMYFYAASGLDPLQSSDGNEKVLDAFKAQDTIEGIRQGGSGEWWQGEPKTIEANKRKYLKKRD
jgi:hypothetical protein